jgi:two-component system, NtrC family, nitrogen regulation response regulator NtrX
MRESMIMVVDDEEGIRESLSGILEDEHFTVTTAESGEEALGMLKEHSPDLVLLDVWMKGMDGIATLKEIRKVRPDLPVVMVSGHANIELAVSATREGAYDFLEKPLSLERVVLVVQRALEKRNLEIENLSLKRDLTRRWNLVGTSRTIRQLKEQIEVLAKSNSRVLILGESGVGKELIARLIHEKSPRADKPFIEVNCAAIPQELIESEVFGHEKGSFTGAFERKKGKFELADEGTLFLDEIGDMSFATQAKMLRVIETQEFQRVGGSRNLKVDVRIISATNKDLEDEVRKGSFREDLLYRLNVIPVHVPPLRERREDIQSLVAHFLDFFALEYGQKPKGISEEGLTMLKSYDWPGNIRELRNVIERLVIMTPHGLVTAGDISVGAPARADYFSFQTLKDARDSFEKDFLIKKLEENNWNISKTAELLEVERSNLHRKIKVYDIKVP